ncbi:hypothetical protein I4U23_026031 [Adineta vaga]|nr:hypothetical protein I4U23_026031 [Adineta vaga]
MSQPIDFRINDYIIEYLESKGYSHTMNTFVRERQDRKEPIDKTENGILSEKEKEKERYENIKEEMLKHLDNGNREEFFQLWSEHIPSNVINNDSSIKSLEFLIYTHFAVYYLRSNISDRDEQKAQENMQIFRSYIESIRGRSISQTSDLLPLFALPYVPEPERHESYKDLFSDEWPVQLRKKVWDFLEWVVTGRSLPSLVELLQNGERASQVLVQINNENEELKYRNRETNRQLKNLSTDYYNLINITMELVETLQQAIVGKTITNDYIDNVCARLLLARTSGSLATSAGSSRSSSNDHYTEKLDFGKIKRDLVNLYTSAREKALLLQALRWKLTKAKSDFQREKIIDSFIGCDLLGCRSDLEQRAKIIQQLSSPIGSDAYYVKEEWARLINTLASLRKGRNYLAPNEALIICMQKATVSEASDTLIKQHLLAALQKLSLRRSVQTIMINHNTIRWLIPLLSHTDRLSDYTLEYGVALLMNLCLRTNGRKKCAEIAEQAINVLSSLLTHPNQETRPYVNSSLYSILTLKSIRSKAMELNLDSHLRSLIRVEKANSETKGQLEFLLNLLLKGGDQDGRQTSDNEQDNDDEDQDIMEADLDLADKLRATDKELSGETLINEHYISRKSSLNTILRHTLTNDMKSKSTLDPVLQRPTTPGQLRHATTAHAVDSLAHSLAMVDVFNSHSDGFESAIFSSSPRKRLSTSDEARISNDEEQS